MENKRVLLVTQEMEPYLQKSSIARITRYLAPYLQDQDLEIRLLMPRFGTINEKRHRLHEVVRLSGMNIIIDEEDIPLIIKVASLPDAQMQVYFLDNEDLFSRKAVFRDDSNQFFEDNDLRMVFFCKAALETVKKLGWQPDLIHCHGWMTSLIPLYLKKVYNKEPVFENAKSIYSVYENQFSEKFNSTFPKKAKIASSIKDKDLKDYSKGSFVDINKGAINAADAVILGNNNIDPDLEKHVKSLNGKPILDYKDENEYLEAYYNFYSEVLSN
jgi:starch synthase